MRPAPPSPARWRRRRGAVALAIAAIAATLLVATLMRPVGLTEVLLLVLAEVIGVSVLAGRTVAAATAGSAFLAVNWLLVPPYGTLHIQAQENWVSLAVFLVLSVGVSTLVESILASERQAAGAEAREAALSEALGTGTTSAADAIRILRTALDLDAADLVELATGRVVASDRSEGDEPPDPVAALEVPVGPGYLVRGFGPGHLGARTDFVAALATAVVRAWDSERLVAEQERSARLAEVDAARSALLATVGHDLRTPLAGIRVSVDALTVGGDTLTESDRADLLAGLRESAIRLDTLIGAVLDSSRIEAGVATVDPQPTDLRQVVAAAAADLDSPRVRLAVGDDPVTALVDPVLLERVVANLLANALAHTPQDRPVELTCRGDGGGPAIVVADHGPGLSADSVDVGRNRHGMGLLLVQRLAGLIGAEVRHEPTPGGGLTVTVRVGAG